MKFFATVLPSFTVVLALALHVQAHASPVPMLGIKGTPQRNQVQRPSTSSPCGNVNIANTIDSSESVPLESDGTTLRLNITNYNAGGDGSRKVSVLVDPTGTGKDFVAANVTKNGDPAPKNNGADIVTIELPAGTKCTGGGKGNLCLLSVKSSAGFGGCTLASQLASSSSSTGSSCKSKGKKAKRSGDRRAVGTRAALAARGESLHQNPVF
ncbi:hypothetical protein MIND_00311800 [Mycena indigotica]|uniref:GEgh 16 protein n=1 Tax=Mycena indigotica TaxID=2126181 RepID=A0A8H6SZY5_9AGAR|nr:uncharacterized protein MIND_00311800 [Mycena indigotica]KAF7309410.1 hypothetical protein MIND_00311800 [Mycena indigotica]